MEAILDPDCDIINTLPEEILEGILSYLSPYGECKQAMMVCKRWYRVIQGMLNLMCPQLPCTSSFEKFLRPAFATEKALEVLLL